MPGPAGDALSAGCHELLRKGASLVESVEDVLAALNLGAIQQTRLALEAIEPARQAFDLDSLDPVERQIIDAFGRPENEKKGVIVVDGHMVERLHFAMAQRTVAIAEQIRQMEQACG